MRRLLLALLPAVICCSASTQQMLLHPDGQMPSFEVVTIKPGSYWAPSGPLGFSSVLWLTIPKMTMREFIAVAYGQQLLIGNTSPRVYGGPEWLDHDHYSMQAKISDDILSAMKTASQEQQLKQLCLMEQSLLARRYNLKSHFEMREIPVYELHVANGGLKLKPDEANDLHMSSTSAASSKGVKISINHATMAELSEELVGYVDRPVVDKTMLGGRYSLHLLVSATGTGYEGVLANRNKQSVVRPGEAVAQTNDAPSLFTALRDLGLQLVPVKGQVEVVVIDSVGRPSEN